MGDRLIERPLGRREDLRLITGRGSFVADLIPDGCLHSAFARSHLAHGEIVDIDTQAAAESGGVRGVFTAAELTLNEIPSTTGPGPQADGMARPPLATSRVRYVGEPVAVVVADTPAEAVDAATEIWVDLEPLPVVADAHQALNDETLLFSGAGTNRVHHSIMGDQAPREYPVSVSIEVENQRLAPVPIEPLVILAEPDGDGGLHVTCSHQAPHRLRDQLSALLELPREAIRVTVPDVGGAFGLKGMLFPEYLVVAAAALRLERPVIWVETRREHFTGGTHGRGQIHRVELGGDPSGRIRSARVEILAETGAYPHNGSQIPLFSRYVAVGPYDIEHVGIEMTVVVTNRAPTGSYRGAGRPEAAFAIDRAVEAFARTVGMDPVDVRRINLIRSFPYETVTGARYDSGDYVAALDRAVEVIDAPAVRAEQARRRAEGGDPIGLGFGAFVERAGGGVDSAEFARVEIDPDGAITVFTGSTSAGQGHETVWAGIAADVFTVDPGRVTVVAGDTALVADGVGSFASRSAQIGGSAVLRTADRVKERAREVAAKLLEVEADDLVLEEGAFHVAETPDVAVGIDEVAASAAKLGVVLAEEELYSPHAQTFPYGVHAAVVEVRLETGEVEILELVAVDDCGRVLNPMIVEGQIVGSLVQGIGQALTEGILYDGDGQLLTSTLMDYVVPGAGHIPPITSARLEHPAPSNPLGVKGSGEAGCIGAPPAIVNAVLDALVPYGVTDLQMPLQPHRVWAALQQAGQPGFGREAPPAYSGPA